MNVDYLDPGCARAARRGWQVRAHRAHVTL